MEEKELTFNDFFFNFSHYFLDYKILIENQTNKPEIFFLINFFYCNCFSRHTSLLVLTKNFKENYF